MHSYMDEQEITNVFDNVFGWRSQFVPGFFSPKRDPYDDWGMTAEEAFRLAADAMNSTDHRETEAMSLLLYAAFRGYPIAMYHLGFSYHTGDQIKREHRFGF